MPPRFVAGSTLLLALGLVSMGCQEAGSALSIPVAARIGDRPFDCSKGQDIGGQDLRFFVHDVRLVDAEGREGGATFVEDGRWQQRDVALLDFEDGTGACRNGTTGRHESLELLVPPGDWVELRFRIGVPFELNHADPAVASGPLTVGQLHWGWQAGYKFLRFEASVSGEPFRLHLGATGCEGEIGDISSCSQSNRPEFRLEGFQPGQSRVVFDLAPMLADVRRQEGDGRKPGCMSLFDDPHCELPFSVLGLDLQSGEAGDTQHIAGLERIR